MRNVRGVGGVYSYLTLVGKVSCTTASAAESLCFIVGHTPALVRLPPG